MQMPKKDNAKIREKDSPGGKDKGDSPAGTLAVGFLKLLSKDELKEFDKFVHSPFFNNRSEVSNYFDAIKKYHPEFSHRGLTKEKIYAELYPTTKFRDDVIRRLNSNLFKLGEEYGAYKNWRKNDINYEKSLLGYYFTKNAEKSFQKQLTKTESYLGSRLINDTEYFYNLSQVNEIERNHMLKYDPTYKKSGFEKQIVNQWKYLLSSMLRLYGFAEFEKFFFSKKYELHYSDELLRIAEDSRFMGSQAIEIYYLAYKLYGSNKSDAEFFRLKELIKENSSLFDKAEMFNLYIHLFNYCNINKLQKDVDYSRVEYELAREMVEQELILNNGVVDPGWFRGIFFKIYNAGEIEFAEQFINKYKRAVSGDDSENVVYHALAQLAMHKKEYDKALKYLAAATYQHINDKWLIKNIYLKIFYETSSHDQFFYTVDSIRHLIKEEGSWNENLITPIRNFITHAAKLFRIKLKETDSTVDDVRHEILKSKTIGRPWLLEKADELERGA